MLFLRRILLVSALLLSGCTVHVHNSSDAARVIGVGFIAAMIYSAENGNDYRGEPPLDPTRKVSEQDCTKPIDSTLGNLRCK